MLYALDLETCCDVPSCSDYGKSICRNDHSLSPWKGRITQLAVWSPDNQIVGHGQDRAVEVVRDLLGAYNTKFVGHSAKFDLLWLAVKAPELAERLREAWVADTNLMAFVHTKKIPDQWIADYIANAPPGNRKAGKHSLKTLAPYFLGVEPYWESTSGGHESEEYVLKDVEYTYRLYQHLLAKMNLDELSFVDEKLLPWAKMCLEAELAGMRLDVEGLLAYQEELRVKETALRAELDERWQDAHAAYYNIQLTHVHSKYDAMKLTKAREPRREAALAKVPTQVDYDSPAQMRWLLADFYGYDVRSLEGNETTGKEVLNRLADEGHDDVRTYLEWRKTQKVLTAFIPGLLEQADECGYVHPIFNITGTRTGRLSCERPNLQQTPKELKRFFLPDEGEVMIGYDAKAIEAKLIGIYTDDPKICEIVLSGASFHDNNAREFFGLECPTDQVSKAYPKERRAAKTIGFAGLYGAGANRIRISFTQAGFPVSTSEAKRIYFNYRRAYETAFEKAGEIVNALEEGETINNLLGRPVHFDNPDEVYMQGFNRLIQGSASDYNMHAAFEALTKLRAAGIPAKPRLFVHDYIGASVPRAQAAEADRLALQALCAMRLTTSYGEITLDYEGGVSDGWE
jgi:DNA polymerase I-like protein with 3'-5' exonuclease and polymerase domains